MCGFLYSNEVNKQFVLDDIKSRGPDENKELLNDYGYFYQSRLITNTNSVVCPAVNDYGVLLYNGTEYYSNNDTDLLVNNLTNDIDNNLEFFKTLQGDFAICFVTDRHIFLATDTFATKPIYFGSAESFICIASTPTPIKQSGIIPFLIEPNLFLVFDKVSQRFVVKTTITHFNLEQTQDNLDKIFLAFEESVLARHKENCLVNLSSGYDSGAIVACLNKHDKKYQKLVYIPNENKEILKERLLLDKNKNHLVTRKQIENRKNIKSNKYHNKNLLDETGTISDLGLETATIAKNKNCRINLTGTGSDELYSDYGFNGSKLISYFSLFGGFFPEKLDLIFPWYTSKTYPLYNDLKAVDYCNGLYGIDSRHPFLDKKLFQTWLVSKNYIKNKSYKHWIEQYLIQTKYPFVHEKIALGKNFRINTL